MRSNERCGSTERQPDAGDQHDSILHRRQRAQSEESTEPRYTLHSIDLMALASTRLVIPKLPRPAAVDGTTPLPQQAGAASLFRRTCSEPTSTINHGDPSNRRQERSTSPRDRRRTSSTIAITVRRVLSTVFVRVSSLGRGNSM